MEYNDIRKKRFDQVWDLIVSKGLIKQIYPEEAKIRLSLPLKNGQGQYIFKLNRNGQVDNLTTFAITENDVFVPSGISVMIGLTGADGVQHLYPYAPKKPQSGDSVYAFGFENDNIEALWNGNLTFKQDTNIVLNQFPMERFKVVPRQQGASRIPSFCFALSTVNKPPTIETRTLTLKRKRKLPPTCAHVFRQSFYFAFQLQKLRLYSLNFSEGT